MKLKPEQLIDKYLAGNCSEEERSQVETWYLELAEQATDRMDDPNYLKLDTEMWPTIEKAAYGLVQQKRKAPVKVFRLSIFKYVAAAVLLVVMGLGIFNYLEQGDLFSYRASKLAGNVIPGSNKAYLTLADGKRINLNDAEIGNLAEQTGITVTKAANGQLVYTAKAVKPGKIAQYNLIETPRGGQYQLNLPDGTRVWLNAASSLRFPVSFAGSTARSVELSGEAYFEVTKNKSQPFKVISNGQTVEVLGTHFNVNSYADEPTIKTTLLEGSVKVLVRGNSVSKIIIPGEQAVVKGKAINVVQTDVEADTDWKNGDFIFSDDDINTVMRKISRWYDVEVVYEGDINSSAFGGTISRSKSIEAVLRVLEETGGVHFKVEGRRVTVKQ